jgi:uncharacterized membrane protein
MMDAVVGTYLVASVGTGLEVFFTGLSSLRKRNVRLTGHSYLWMFPIYGLAYPLFHWLWPVVGEWPLVVRGLLYVVIFFALEYTSGWLLRRLVGVCPWEEGYRAARCGVHGLIRLDYAPVWVAVVLLFERIYLWLPGTP